MPADDDYGFTDEETGEVSLEEEMEEVSPEEELEAAREACVVELREEAAVAFIEYRNYNRIDLTIVSDMMRSETVCVRHFCPIAVPDSDKPTVELRDRDRDRPTQRKQRICTSMPGRHSRCGKTFHPHLKNTSFQVVFSKPTIWYLWSSVRGYIGDSPSVCETGVRQPERMRSVYGAKARSQHQVFNNFGLEWT